MPRRPIPSQSRDAIPVELGKAEELDDANILSCSRSRYLSRHAAIAALGLLQGFQSPDDERRVVLVLEERFEDGDVRGNVIGSTMIDIARRLPRLGEALLKADNELAPLARDLVARLLHNIQVPVLIEVAVVR